MDNWIPMLVFLSSFLTGILIFLLGEEQHVLRILLNMSGAVVKLIFVGIMLWGVFHEHRYETRYSVLPGIDVVLYADALSLLFVTLSSVLWLVTTIYAIGYLEGSPNRSRFFGFFSLCVASTMGISLAGNLFTFFLFYEMLTLTTYPLVVHRGTEKALRAGKVYLKYTLTGGAVLLLGIVWLHTIAGGAEFTQGGALRNLSGEHRASLIMIFALLIGGLGVKSALVPLHGWLPVAMVAPAPVSALLHAVAVVKAGAFGIVRVVYNIYGAEFASNLGVLGPLAAAAALTIIYGSLRALVQDDLKRRLAYSTVSQLSYITLGVAIVGPVATIGGLVHLVHQGIMKITLFFCAGNLAETLGIHRVSEMDGVGRRMPWTMAAFSIAALGMIGVPPMAGFITKWYLGTGAVEAGLSWVGYVLGLSSLLNAAYFLPIIYAAWFGNPTSAWSEERGFGRFETGLMLLLPSLVTALLTLLAGALANMPFSPLDWAKLIAHREYLPPLSAGEFRAAVGMSVSIENILSTMWPVLAGALLVWIARRTKKGIVEGLRLRVPPGGLIESVVTVLAALTVFLNSYIATASAKWKTLATLKAPVFYRPAAISDAIVQIENNLSHWFIAGVVFLILAALLFGLLGNI